MTDDESADVIAYQTPPLVTAEPASLPRVETGPLQIDDDWPGYFIRGDDAFALALDLERAVSAMRDSDDPTDAFALINLESLRQHLAGADVRSGVQPQRITRAGAPSIDWQARALAAETEFVSLRRQLRCAGLHAPEPFTHTAEDPAIARTGARWEREHVAALDLLAAAGDDA